MNLFTSCQALRMQKVLENSPRRKSLLTSKAMDAPIRYELDLGIRNYTLNNTGSSCSDEILPVISLRNYGTENITGFTISMFAGDALVSSIERNFTLSELSTTTVAFPAFQASADMERTIAFKITELADGTDDNPSNNDVVLQLPPTVSQVLPYVTEFDNISENDWYTSSGSSWRSTKAAFESVDNQAFVLPYFESSETNYGELDFLVSPLFSPVDEQNNSISFYYAYSQNKGEFTDGLIVAVSTDCGQTFPRENYLFEEYGGGLETSASLSQEFVPIYSGDWKKITLDLSGYIDQEIRIAFIGQNGNGNNIFLDKFSFGFSTSFSNDAAISPVSDFSIVNCYNVIDPFLFVSNEGTERITDIKVAVSTNGALIDNFSFNNLNIRSGNSETIRIPATITQEGINAVSFEIFEVNGLADENEANNIYQTNILIDSTADLIPIREDFEDESLFATVSSSGSSDWNTVLINDNTVMKSDNFTQGELGKENWLVSPVLNVADFSEASLTFEVAYAQRNGIVDGLRVLVSTNCSGGWNEVVYNKRGSLLSTVETSVETEWLPSSQDDWRRETIDLTPIVEDIFTDQIRVAFVTINGNGNNIYLDNIAFFDTSEPNILDNGNKLTVFPNPAIDEFFISLDLPEKESVEITIFDISGRVVNRRDLPNALNQRVTVTVPGLRGVYFVYVKGKNINESKRILMGR
ncbi:MAG: choice-of-anchor J domain-containing protein, partial [Cyclobacteriaceae bacterium]